MFQGTTIDELIESVQRAEAAVQQPVAEKNGDEPAFVYELPQPEPMIGVA